MELLLVEAWLVTLAALGGIGIGGAAAPLWLIALTLVVSWCIARALLPRSRALGAAAAALSGVALLILLVRASPATYGMVGGGLFDPGWISALGNDLRSGSPRVGAVVVLAALLVYLGWRGIASGLRPLDIDAVLLRLKLGIGALVVAIVVGSATVGPERAPLVGILALLAPLFVFAGLVASALARLAWERTYRRGDTPHISRGGAWLGWSVLLAATVVGVALLVNLIFNVSAIQEALRQLGPVGALLSTLVTFLVNAWAWLVGLILNPLIHWLMQFTTHHTSNQQLTPPPRQPQHSTPTPAWQQILASVIQFAIALGLVAIAAYLVYIAGRELLGGREKRPEGSADEEREGLDARSLLRGQVRDLLGALIGGGQRAPARRESLARGSVRWLFRELLRAGGAAGIERRPEETADEYMRRLATLPAASNTPVFDAAELRAIGETYDEARYGEHEPPEAERSRIRTRIERLIAQMRQRAGGH
jgi:hypothetical protein